MIDRSGRSLAEQMLAYTPQPNRTWWCPWFIVLCTGCLTAIIAGVLAASIIGSALVLLAIAILCWQIGLRQARPPTYR